MRSIFMLGSDTDAEWRLTEALGGAPRRFFALAQRVAWGITQPDLVRVDVIASVARMVRSHGDQFPAHLYDAWVWRVRDPERAERSLARARALATDEHPFRYLLPTEDEWQVKNPSQRLVDVVPDAVWRVTWPVPLAGSPFPIRATATILRTAGGLAIVNPVPLEPRIADDIEALGRVRWLCSQGKAHGAFVGEIKRRFPQAVALGTRGHLTHPPAARLVFDDLMESAEGFPAEIERIPLEGSLLEEVALFHRPTSTLLLQDFVLEPAPTSPFVGRLYSFAFGLIEQGVGFPSVALLMWQNMRKLHASIRSLRDTRFARFATAHGPTSLYDAANLTRCLDDLLSIGGAEHKLLVGRYALALPGFLRDAVRYLLTTRHVHGAHLAES